MPAYDYIFIDCPPSLDLLTINGLCACDTVLIPIQCEYYALEGLSELMNTLKTVRKKYNRYLDIEGVVFTMYAGRLNLTMQVVAQVKKYYGNKVYRTVVPRTVRLSEAPSFGMPINFYEPNARAATPTWRWHGNFGKQRTLRPEKRKVGERMAKRKLGGLGRGLDSCSPTCQRRNRRYHQPAAAEIEPDPDQPRKNFDEEALAALAQSIAENGLLQPIAVRPRKAGPGYTIIAGERRWRAARMAGLEEVPVLVKDVTDEQAAALALIENLQREDLDPIEVAEGCRRLIDQYGLTQEQAAQRLGKSRSALTNTLRLLGLPEDVREQVRTGAISTRHAKAILGLPSEQMMRAAAEQVTAKTLNVRQTEALCRLTRPPKAPKPGPDAFNRRCSPRRLKAR